MDARTDIPAAVRAARGDMSMSSWLAANGLTWGKQALYRLERGALNPTKVAELAAAGVLSPELALLGLAFFLRVPLESAREVAASGEARLAVSPRLLRAWCARCLAS